ncbi:MAG: molybdenum cofactor biosynthesis protein MoaE [Gammaproteobacteria bacterium]|nr:MAG: molybdenum cofactor biosynthesis protein MoaE [Gammaproteobacteria bacterium]
MRVALSETDFDPWRALAEYQEARLAPGRHGATAVFVGTMREFNEDASVVGMRLEHYPGMTERELERLLEAAAARWSLLDALVLHRVGELSPGDPIVLVAVWAAHRREAFEACRWLMEELKSNAPFWKKERLADGRERWVEKNTPGY